MIFFNNFIHAPNRIRIYRPFRYICSLCYAEYYIRE